MLQAWRNGTWGCYDGPHSRALTKALQELHAVEDEPPIGVELVSSGTVAVELTLRAVGVSDGDEVILAAYDYPGNFLSVLACGAMPVLVDIEPGTGQIDVSSVKRALSERTKAIIATHLHGALADVAELRALADEHRLLLIEDAAQMPGAIVQGRRAGSWGHAGIISFGGSKLLSAGRGGAILTRDQHLLLRLRRQSMRGPNRICALSELQAAVLVPQVESLEAAEVTRSRAVQHLAEELRELTWLQPFRNRTRGRPGYYKLGFWFDPEAAAPLTRDAFVWAMQADGVPFAPGFRALHVGRSARRYRAAGELHYATQAHEQVVVLHHSVLLQPPESIRRVAAAVRRVFEHRQAVVRAFEAEGGTPGTDA